MKKLFKILLILLIITFLVIANSYLVIDVTNYEINNDKIPDSFNNYKIMLLSDLHNRNINKKISNIIERENPDIIVMSGDMANYDAYNNFLDLCNMIKNNDIYYVVGNHEQDMKKGFYNNFINEISSYVNILDNEKEIIEKDDEYINLYGLSYPLRYYSSKGLYILSKEDIVNRIGNSNKNEYNILLTHNPLFYEAYSDWGSDLTLSGHMHGGMIKLPYIGGLLSPDFTFFPKYSEGNNKINDMNLIVSRGLGYGYSFKIRFNNPGEVVLITLKSK